MGDYVPDPDISLRSCHILGKSIGMVTLEESVASLVRRGAVDRDLASSWARYQNDFAKLVAR